MTCNYICLMIRKVLLEREERPMLLEFMDQFCFMFVAMRA